LNNKEKRKDQANLYKIDAVFVSKHFLLKRNKEKQLML
jgi:hypothetical protein